ncbi:hypothetical protein GCM10010994_41900 [Chelatococcus reniformis]|uniref:Protein BatD n=2 Tax=Chelatococcus reniformis TaxID=1494448 RepID=A0A916XJY2_9HYPH|nr:hypothetical protein GCM10010994_41900 [Chelatococcus reniformis]
MLWLCLLTLWLAAPVQAQPATGASPQPPILVRTSVAPAQGAVVGQRIALYVDVLFRGEMPRPPRVTVPELPGAQIIRFESQATTINDTIAGTAYIGQRFEFAVYARHGGSFTVPPATVTVLDRDGNETSTVHGEAVTVAVAVPPGVDVSKPVIASNRVELDESWAPSPTTAFRAGDAIVRTITRTAADVPGLAMRDLGFAAPPGVRVYVDTPVSRDEVARGVVTGRRTDKVTYVFEQEGRYALPEVAQPWWDLGAGTLRQASGAGVAVAVTAAPSGSGLGQSVGGGAWQLMAAVVAGAATIVALLVWALPRLDAWRARRRQRWEASEAKAFRDLMAACRGDDATGLYGALATWRRRLPAEAASRLAPLAEPLEQALFGSPRGMWSPPQAKRLGDAAQAARTALLVPDRQAVAALPPLNPGAAVGARAPLQQVLNRAGDR